MRLSRSSPTYVCHLRHVLLQILCGCGPLDGTEISEAISAAIHICQKDMKPLFYAPDVEISGIIDHLTKELDGASPPRNALVEAARLARCCIKPLCECEACTHGALVIPGGFGAARILYVCTMRLEEGERNNFLFVSVDTNKRFI